MNKSESFVRDKYEKEGWKVLRNGWPDFFLCREQKDGTREYLAVEVKGPEDRLRYEQIIMHKYLQSFGLKIEIIRVDPKELCKRKYNKSTANLRRLLQSKNLRDISATENFLRLSAAGYNPKQINKLTKKRD